MYRVALLCLAAVFILITGANADGCPLLPNNDGCIFYGGDFDYNDPNQNALANENDAIVGGNPYGSATYQNFVANAPWWVNDLFTNTFSGLSPSSGYWEIRSGLSEGHGGTLIASGTATGDHWSHLPTGRNAFGFIEYTDAALELDVSIDAGTYWFSVVPNDPNNANRSFNSNTTGLNGVGEQISGQQYWNSAFFGANFTNANNAGVYQTFSSGIANWIPEPSSLILLGSGLLDVGGVIRHRFAR